MGRERGERCEFRQLFETNADSVFRFLFRLARNRHDAEDLLQETFVRLWRKREQFRGDGSFAGYARRVAFRTYLNARPRLARRSESVPIESCGEPPCTRGGPAEQASRADVAGFLLARVRAAIDALPDSLREPIILFRIEGLKVKEIAEMLGITPKAAEHRVARALHQVSAQVQDVRTEYQG
jgi:RNA polymerase sigma factor (sigma-70 family)